MQGPRLRGCAQATTTTPLDHPTHGSAQGEGSQCTSADLELGALCLVGGVPGPSSCSISGSMPEGCSGTVALLPWSVEWVLAGSRWELRTQHRKNKEWHTAFRSWSHALSGGLATGTRLHDTAHLVPLAQLCSAGWRGHFLLFPPLPCDPQQEGKHRQCMLVDRGSGCEPPPATTPRGGPPVALGDPAIPFHTLFQEETSSL